MNIIESIKYKLWLKKHSRYCEFIRKRYDKKKVEFIVKLLEGENTCNKHNIVYNPYEHIQLIIDDFCPECYMDKIKAEAYKLDQDLIEREKNLTQRELELNKRIVKLKKMVTE